MYINIMLNLQCFNSARRRGNVHSQSSQDKITSKKLSIQECVFLFFLKKRLSAGFLSNTFKFNQRCSAEFSGAGRKTLNEM